MLKRTLTAIIFASVMLFGIFFSAYSFWLLFLIITLLATNEFYNLLKKSHYQPHKTAGLLFSLILFLLTTNNVGKSQLSFDTLLSQFDTLSQNIEISLIIIFVAMINLLELLKPSPKPFESIALSIFPFFYITIPMAFFFNLSVINDFDPWLPFGILLLIWSNDTFAYLVGSQFGKHKLYERISPKKTWEGTIGGLILTISVAIILANFIKILALKHWIVIACIVGIMGSIGDLIESMLKRSLNIKDSGNLLPGHGGILDRFDALIYVSPFVHAYLLLLE